MLRTHNHRDRLAHAVVVLAAVFAAVYAVITGGGDSSATNSTGSEQVAVPPPIERYVVATPEATLAAVADARRTESTAASESIGARADKDAATSTPEPELKGPWPTIEAARIKALGVATPTPSAKLRCEPSDSPAYCIYTVQEGDTLGHVAERFGLNGGNLPGWELLAASNKPEVISVNDFIQPGQKLRVPTRRGVVHTVLLDETVGDLADIFDVTSRSIITANNLGSGDLIRIGSVLLIPDPKQLEPPPRPAPAPEPEKPADQDPKDEKDEGDRKEPESESKPETPARKPGFVWPITASVRVTNYMSARHPLGIDLGLGHAPGSAIVAVDDGKVVFAGGNACCSYGLYVIVEHANGLKTLYGHLSRIEVSVGQRVSQGQRLGPSGSTGYSTGVHLHFEVHKDGKRVDPMPYLP